MARGTVLVAEDERNLADALSFLMQRAGLEVTIARDGPSTVATAQRIRPDVIVLDIMLPGFDGFEVVSTLRAQADGHTPRIIMLTAKGHEKDKRKALELGVDDYVTKPFSNRDVVERVQALLSQ
ncbi:response regulator transcription factor [Bauldia sp.]|uniref:response regulator transcription factor n=1 Tax=Bauldia sp. TaxID=2575872 RepID=UPI003BAD6899